MSEETWHKVRWMPIVGIALSGVAALLNGKSGQALIWLTLSMCLCAHLLYLDFKEDRESND